MAQAIGTQDQTDLVVVVSRAEHHRERNRIFESVAPRGNRQSGCDKGGVCSQERVCV